MQSNLVVPNVQRVRLCAETCLISCQIVQFCVPIMRQPTAVVVILVLGCFAHLTLGRTDILGQKGRSGCRLHLRHHHLPAPSCATWIDGEQCPFSHALPLGSHGASMVLYTMIPKHSWTFFMTKTRYRSPRSGLGSQMRFRQMIITMLDGLCL